MHICNEILDLLSARLDGALTTEEERLLNEHLDVCPECRALAHDLALLHGAMSHMAEVPPPEIKEAVMARIKAETGEPIPFPQKKRQVRPWQTWGAAAAVLVVVAAGAFALQGRGGNSGGGTVLAMPSAMPSTTPAMEDTGDAPLRYKSSLTNEGAETAPAGEGDQTSNPPLAPAAIPQPAVSDETAPPSGGIGALMIAPELTPEQAAQKLCDEVLGEDAPETQWTQEEGQGSCLLPGGYSLQYLGLSEDGKTHEFEVYQGAEEGQRYAVPLDGSEILLLE